MDKNTIKEMNEMDKLISSISHTSNLQIENVSMLCGLWNNLKSKLISNEKENNLNNDKVMYSEDTDSYSSNLTGRKRKKTKKNEALNPKVVVSNNILPFAYNINTRNSNKLNKTNIIKMTTKSIESSNINDDIPEKNQSYNLNNEKKNVVKEINIINKVNPLNIEYQKTKKSEPQNKVLKDKIENVLRKSKCKNGNKKRSIENKYTKQKMDNNFKSLNIESIDITSEKKDELTDNLENVKSIESDVILPKNNKEDLSNKLTKDIVSDQIISTNENNQNYKISNKEEKDKVDEYKNKEEQNDTQEGKKNLSDDLSNENRPDNENLITTKTNNENLNNENRLENENIETSKNNKGDLNDELMIKNKIESKNNNDDLSNENVKSKNNNDLINENIINNENIVKSKDDNDNLSKEKRVEIGNRLKSNDNNDNLSNVNIINNENMVKSKDYLQTMNKDYTPSIENNKSQNNMMKGNINSSIDKESKFDNTISNISSVNSEKKNLKNLSTISSENTNSEYWNYSVFISPPITEKEEYDYRDFMNSFESLRLDIKVHSLKISYSEQLLYEFILTTNKEIKNNTIIKSDQFKHLEMTYLIKSQTNKKITKDNNRFWVDCSTFNVVYIDLFKYMQKVYGKNHILSAEINFNKYDNNIYYIFFTISSGLLSYLRWEETTNQYIMSYGGKKLIFRPNRKR